MNRFYTRFVAKLVLFLVTILLFQVETKAQGTFYSPQAHITGFYINNCAGQVKIRCLYQDVGDWGIEYLNIYYRNTSGNYVRIVEAKNNFDYSNGWSDHYAGSGRNYSFRSVNGATIYNGYKTNEGDLHYFDFVWANIPTDAYANGIITISSDGRGGNNTWSAGPSNSVQFQYPMLMPPTSLAATDQVHCGKIALNWTLPSSFPCGYSQEIYRNNNYLATVNSSTTTYDDNTVGNEGYSYTVKAVHIPTSGVGRIESINSNPGNGAKRASLSAPSGITASDNDCNGKINLSWNYYSANPISFRIYESTTPGATGGLLATIDGGDRSYARTAPARNTTYYYKVSTQGVCGETYSTNTYPGMSPTTPIKPRTISAVPNGANTGIVVTWKDSSSDETGFIIERSVQGGGASTLINVGANTESYTDFDISACVNYTYTVRARNNCQPGGVPSTVSITTRIFPDISTSFNNTTNKLKCSKGYFSNMVQLEWATPNIDLIDQYRIYRKVYGASGDSVLVGTATKGSGAYYDNTAVSGVLYRYTLIGVMYCAGFTRYSNVSDDLGFRSASGTVSGRISYQGGFALKNAKVMVTPASSAQLGASILLSGTGQLSVPSSATLSFTNGITTENWFKPNATSGTQNLVILTSGSKTFTVRMVNNQVQVVANNGSTSKTVTGSTTVLANNFNQVTAALKTDSLLLYLNGIPVGGVSLSGFSFLPLNNSSVTMGSSFSGNIDEVRLYNRYKTKTQAFEDYSRKVSPDDDELRAYYMFDENVIGYNGFFDYSKKGIIYNENHGTIVNGSFNSSTPSTSQLAFASYTDETGSYIVTNISYQSTGQVFTVTPSFETHAFDPINRTVFIGEGSIVHNQQDFLDKSSFAASGTVFYAGTTCPAEGIRLKIDGELVVNAGEPVTTDQFGAFNIQVPIGNHVITTEKEGHIFSAGRFPTTGVYNFQNIVAGIQFTDSTLIKVIGRAVGGAIEASKKPGLGLSVNNIGKTRLHFKSQLGNGCSKISITTNDSTGEYVAYLPPLVYTVDTAKVLTNPVINFGIQPILDLTNATSKKYSGDTSYVTGTSTISRIDSISYHVRRDFIFYTTPEISFSRTRNRTSTDSSFIGEVKLDIDTVNFISIAPVNPFVYPVFKQYKDYQAKVSAYDVYENKDRVPSTKYKVPLDGRLLVANDIASAEQTIQSITVTGGSADYQFRAASPELSLNGSNPSQSFTKTIQAIFFTTGNDGERSVNWLPNPGSTPYRAIVFGGRQRGNNIITSGPEKVDLILRDPPGSASSTTWSRNTNYNSIKRWSDLNNTGGSFMGNVHLGGKFATGAAAFAFFAAETEVGGTLGFGVTKETTAGSNGELIETYSSSISISTGSGPDQVGSNADIFFGHSTNYSIGVADNLMLVEQAVCNMPNAVCGTVNYNGYRIGLKQSLALDPSGIQTVFAYTTGEITDIVIPNLEKARNLILTQSKKANGQRKYIINFTDTEDADYVKKYAANNDDPVWGSARTRTNPLTLDAGDSTGPSYTYIPDRQFDPDSVRHYNNQIRLWKEALAKNEREKYEAFALNIGNVLNSGTNTSIGKASITREFATTKSKEETSYEEVTLNHDEAHEFKAITGGLGISFQGTLTLGETNTTDNGSSTDTTTTISYTLNDGDDGDLISVDIVDPKSGNGHLFKMRGGQTSCPFEDVEWAHFYKPGDTVLATTSFENGESVKLSDGTAQRHVPKIQIPQSIKFNVPADQPATFTLQLGNESESDDEQEYSLRVIEVTNPNGAVLTIDGLDPNRNFSVPFASSISKTLSIRRGTEYYDYDSILLVFKSPCDDELSDSAYVSVHFIPTCTQPVVYSPGDKWTLNNSFRDTMNIIINGYDYNFGGLKNINLQYKASSSSQWNILETFHKVPLDADDKIIPTIQPYIEYAWNMKQMVDGPYDIRAVSSCYAPGHDDSKKESTINSGLADRVNPSPFGNPSPADGILSPNDEIMIQFNEPVDNASLSYANFDIRGVLNGSALQNTASLYFDGNNDFVEVPAGLNLSKKSFSLEFWAKRKTLGQQVVFSQGIDEEQYLSIGFDAANKFNFRIGNEFVRSNLAFTDTVSFHHFTVSYNFDTDQCELFIDGIVSNTGNTAIYNNYEGGGKTFIGKLSKDNTSFYTGNLRDFRLWTKTRNSAAILSSINNSLKGTEAGIIANWRLDEAVGTEAKDYVRARHATIKNAVWEISPKGTAYKAAHEPLSISAGDLAFTQESDFTIEFWFKGNNGNDYMSLFSNGRGDSTDANPEIRWNIEKDPDGKIFVKHRGMKFEAVSTNFFDGNWHHFALVMQRATSLAAFVDGNQQKSTYPADFRQFGGDRFLLGGRLFQPGGGMDTTDRTFNGYFDEVRLWNSARTQAQIERDRVNRLSGTETGLMFYMPFETYTLNLGVPVLTPGIIDVKSPGRTWSGSTSNGSGLSTETPTIKLQRPVQSINFSYSVNQDKIILTPTTLSELIENVTLDVTVKDVYDLNGNKMQSPRTWIAYVDKNQVKWQDQEFSFVKKTGAALSFTTNIVNSGGALKQFNLQNLPTWLTASPSSATISPNSFKTITFTVDPNVNIGSYESEVQLLTDFGYPDGLLVKLKVYAEVPSTWTVNSENFQNSMSIVGQIRINNVISTNADDKLAVFVNNECRGIAALQYYPQIDRYYAFLNVYSNVTQGETLEFRIWNAGAGKIHADVVPQIQFVSNGQIGTISSPQVFNATDKLTKLIPIAKGWNWVSFNLAMKDSADINKLFSGIRLGSGDIFRSLTTFADYTPADGWVGSLANPMSGVKPEKSYRLRSSNVDTLTTNGIEIDPTTRPIHLDAGWNWLGFISQRNLSVMEAFSSLNATNGDMVKSQSQFALYDENIGWVGSLTALLPGKGYMFRSGANSTFAYPRSAMFGKKNTTENPYESKYFNVDVTKYENNMSAVIDAGVCNEALNSGRLSLGAYSGNELRGATSVSKLSNGKNLFFLNISSNNELEKITFRLLDEETGKTYELEGNTTFESNKLVGDLMTPQTLKNTGSFDCNTFTKQNVASGLNLFVFPNPFNTSVMLNVEGLKAGNLDVKIVDIAGKTVDAFGFDAQGNSTANIEWNPEKRGVSIKPGVYFAEIRTGSQTLRTKVIKY